MTLPPEAPTGPWARVWGRVVVPDAEPRGPGGGTVTFDPDPDPVRVTLAPGKALVASRTVCKVDRNGYLVAPSGRQYVDLVAPGVDVTPEGVWTYTMTLRLPNEPTRRVHVALTRGAVTALADLVPVAPNAGSPSQPPVPPPSGDVAAQVAAARAAAEGARASAESAARDLAAVRADVAAGRVRGPKGDPGTDAREPEITASASSVSHDQPAAVTRTGTYPDVGLVFSIPQGRPGRDGADGQPGVRGDDAREPVFTATATALGEDAQPTVGLSGTYPDLAINFGISRGKPGPQGPPGTGGGGGGSHPLLLSGPRRPDVPTTTGGVITGSEAVGTEYRSTDGAGVGAWVWMKRPAGWVVTDGDTGWRDVTGLLEAAGLKVDSGNIYLRRIPESTLLMFNASLSRDRVDTLWSPGSGFSAGKPGVAHMVGGHNASSLFTITSWSGGKMLFHRTGQVSHARGVVAFHDAPPVWPTDLPGLPA